MKLCHDFTLQYTNAEGLQAYTNCFKSMFEKV